MTLFALLIAGGLTFAQAETAETKTGEQSSPSADVPQKTTRPDEKTPPVFSAAEKTSLELRKERSHTFTALYAPFDLWIPSKLGLSYSFIHNSMNTYELEYLRGTVAIPFVIDDIGKFTDERLSLVKRSYSDRNSFHFYYGLNYSRLNVYLGNFFLNAVSAGEISNYDLINIETLGLTWGLSNRWIWSNGLSFNVDWFELRVPIVTLASDAKYLEAQADEGKKREIRDVMDVIEKIPTAGVFKVGLGYTF